MSVAAVAYLILVIAAFVAFIVGLACAQIYTHMGRRTPALRPPMAEASPAHQGPKPANAA